MLYFMEFRSSSIQLVEYSYEIKHFILNMETLHRQNTVINFRKYDGTC